MKIKILHIIIIFFLASCSSSIRFSSINEAKKRINPITIETDLQKYENYPVQDVFYGLASYYADKFHGRKTANGEFYDMYGLTAAHLIFPFNTIIRVTNDLNNKQIIIRINDRMPEHPERIIDLSLGTATALDMVIKGVVPVKLEILRWGNK